jgi:hypothetical protein
MKARDERQRLSAVMPALGAGIHVLLCCVAKTWMAGDISAFTRVFDALCPAMATL